MNDLSRQRLFQTAIADFLNARREERLRGKENSAISAKYNKPDWLEKTAKLFAKTNVQIGTHIPKATHSDIRNGTIYARKLSNRSEIGTHLLKEGDIIPDATGNGAENTAVLEGWNFLHIPLELEGEKKFLKDWLAEKDPDALAALSDVPEKGKNIAYRFLSFVDREENRVGEGVSDGNAKQIYWLAEGGEASKGDNFILLQPLYPSSLAQVVYRAVAESRFGEKAKAGRKARKEGQAWDGVLTEFRGMAQRNLGGTKTQNVSQLNSLRGGGMLLFSCAPPPFLKQGRRAPLFKTKNPVMGWIMRQKDIRWALGELVTFLKTSPPQVMSTRNRVDGLLGVIAEEVIFQASQIQMSQPAGWSADEECKLPEEEYLWLDPGRYEDKEKFNSSKDEVFREVYDQGDWPDKIADSMAAYINQFLIKKGKLAVGDVEHDYWARARALVIETIWPVPLRRKSSSNRKWDRDLSKESHS